jgi:hypothetical protein
MSFFRTEYVGRLLLGVVALLPANRGRANDVDVHSLGAQVCVNAVSGLTVDTRTGIDAVEGSIRTRSAHIDFMISRNPSLPADMHIQRGKNGYVLPNISNDIALMGESVGPFENGPTGRPIGYGTERLYAFVMRTLSFPDGPVSDKVYIQLWANNHQQNVALLKKVGEALQRCH